MRAGPALRLTRAAIFASVCAVVSGLGHALSSGTALSPTALGIALLVALGLGWWLTGRESSGPLVAGAAAGGQVLLHLLFGVVPLGMPRTGMPGMTEQPVHGARSGMTMTHTHRGMSESSADPMAFTVAYDGLSLTSGMAMAHAAAGLLCGWWLWRGETAFAQLARTLALFVCAPLRLAWCVLCCTGYTLPPAPVRAPRGSPRRPVRLVVLDGISRRGPPLRLSCA